MGMVVLLVLFARMCSTMINMVRKTDKIRVSLIMVLCLLVDLAMITLQQASRAFRFVLGAEIGDHR